MKIETGNTKFEPIVITLEAREEAQALANVFASIGGDPSTTDRKYFDKISKALRDRGIFYNTSGHTGSIYFKDKV